jgi:hypothetical protein
MLQALGVPVHRLVKAADSVSVRSQVAGFCGQFATGMSMK